MGWATSHISKLSEGKTVSFRPRGHSMKGKIESGQLCTVEPISDATVLEKGGTRTELTSREQLRKTHRHGCRKPLIMTV